MAVEPDAVAGAKRTLRYAGAIVLASVWLLWLACTAPASAQDAPDAEPAVKAEPETERDPQPTLLGDQFELELLDPGEDPQPRRYRYTVGDSTTLRLVVDTQTKIDMGSGGKGEFLPAIEQLVSMRVIDVDEDGTGTFEGVVERVNVLPDRRVRWDVREAVEQGIAPIRGARMRFQMDRFGYSSGEVVTGPDGLPIPDPTIQQTMLDSMKAYSAVLPRDPFGVGAVWVERDTVTINGTTSRNESTHTVEAIEGDTLSIRSRVTASLQPHFVENDLMPPGVRIRMDRTTVQAAGRSTFSLSSLDTSSRVRSAGNVYMTIFENGQEIEMRQWTSMTIEADALDEPLPNAGEWDVDRARPDGPGA